MRKFAQRTARCPRSYALSNTLDLTRVKVYPLATRESEAQIDDILIDPKSKPAEVDDFNARQISDCAAKNRGGAETRRQCMLIYGAHLFEKRRDAIVIDLLRGGWLRMWATTAPERFTIGSFHFWAVHRKCA